MKCLWAFLWWRGIHLKSAAQIPWSVFGMLLILRFELKCGETRCVKIKACLLLQQQVVLYLQEEIERFSGFVADQVLRGRQVHRVQPRLHKQLYM